MPWWGWIIVTVVMLTALVVGCVYAGIHAFRAVHSVADTGTEIRKYLDAMQEPVPSSNSNQAPLFTQPLSTAAHRYSLAQTQVECRKITRHNRHAQRWSVWKRNRVPFTSDPNCEATHPCSQPALQTIGSSSANHVLSTDAVNAGNGVKAN
ncbi:hypothetical protein [Bifidobacterium sp. ESL0745]|uniref:hypothetical protein n=1 Tax=Bifidobacterium sp. ESL0745 TaxID=2983226 RepID=UPI0023F647FD|nr:hypothetical protein [Bifidobacterium sp. ESL0745]MDF7665039.1 hypothetical protein [Bifidobacterium sp. ESL0745]